MSGKVDPHWEKRQEKTAEKQRQKIAQAMKLKKNNFKKGTVTATYDAKKPTRKLGVLKNPQAGKKPFKVGLVRAQPGSISAQWAEKNGMVNHMLK